MDETHKEFVDWINRLVQIPESEFLAAFEQFIAHTEHHFAQEGRWMAASEFPPIHCHEEEHQRVLQTLSTLRALVARGDVAIGRRAVEELKDWFGMHAATMDRVLSLHMRNVAFEPDRLPGS